MWADDDETLNVLQPIEMARISHDSHIAFMVRRLTKHQQHGAKMGSEIPVIPFTTSKCVTTQCQHQSTYNAACTITTVTDSE